MTSDADRQSLVEEITQYLAECPQAKDNYDGILWWLTKQRYERVRPLIQSILDELVEQGILRCHKHASSSPIYYLAEASKVSPHADINTSKSDLSLNDESKKPAGLKKKNGG